MKVNHAQKNVLGSGGLDQTKAFNIRTTAHAFKMLSSGLYSDKIGAVLREIACNAMDAHIAAGKPDLPIEVKLPNRVDSQFYIRDWGPGLSHEEVMSLYTSYFASTKQTSNDFTGAFGLGSKSPFSYTDSFSIVSVHGGRKRTYSAYLGNDGSPTISLMTDAPNDSADWEHGVSVGFPVKPSDYAEFTSKANAIYRWFRVTPKILGAPPVTKVTYGFETPVMGRANLGNVVHLVVVMGNVAYPVSAHDLGSTDYPGQWMFNLGNIVIKANIGDVQVAASREVLQYDEDTIKWLRTALNKAAKDVCADLMKSADTINGSPWGARCQARDGFKSWQCVSYTDWRKFMMASGISPAEAERTTNILHGTAYKLPPDLGCHETHVRVITANPSKGDPRRLSYNAVVRGNFAQKTRYGTQPVRAHVTYELSTAVVYGEAVHGLARVKELIYSNTYKQIIFITKNLNPAATNVAAAIQKQVALLAPLVVPMIDVSTLPIPAWATSKQGTRTGRGTRLAKGAPPPPIDDNTTIQVWNFGQRKAEDRRYGDVKGEVKHYMVAMNYWQNSDRSFRIYDRGADTDVAYAHSHWNSVNEAINILQSETSVPKFPSMTAFVPATQAARLKLKERKWPDTVSVIREWFTSKAVQGAVAAHLDKWQPSVPLPANISRVYSWLDVFLFYRVRLESEYDRFIRPLLTEGNVAASIDTLALASLARPSVKAHTVPPVMTAYENVATLLAYTPVTTLKTRTFTSPTELEQTISREYPLTAMHSHNDVCALYSKAPSMAEKFIKYVLKP